MSEGDFSQLYGIVGVYIYFARTLQMINWANISVKKKS